MTRKRYIKLLMAKGLDHNAANAYAELVPGKTSYEKAYKANLALLTATAIFNDLCAATNKFATQISKIVNAVSRSISAFANTLCEAMKEETDDEKTQTQTFAGD